jgi:DNA-binding NarL/FixJ family response regulator
MDAGSRGSRFRWGTAQLVLLSTPIKEKPPVCPPALAAKLSPAEVGVIELAGAGASNAAIARRRRVRVSTVKKQLESAYRKLEVCSRAELTALLVREAANEGGAAVQPQLPLGPLQQRGHRRRR